MGRPRSGAKPKAYLDAWSVLPPQVARMCSAACTRTRLLTLSRERPTAADDVLGPDLALLVVNRLAEMFPDERSWRVYFAHDPHVSVPHQERFELAEQLLEEGYSRRAIALGLELSYATLRNRVRGTFFPIKKRHQYTPEEVAAGYRFLVAAGKGEWLSDSNLCGQVAAIRKAHVSEA